MPASPFSASMLPTTAATVVAFAPPVAALWGRRSWREPAAQVALGWLLAALIGLASQALYCAGLRIPQLPLHAIATGGLPLLLLPPSLTWLGPAAKRRQPVVLAAWLACLAGLVALLGTGRAFVAIGDPVMAVVMCVATGLALGTQARDATTAVREQDWFWILTGHMVYFAVDLFRMPLQEALVARHWDVGFATHNAIMVVYVGACLLITRGMLLRAPAVVPSSSARATPYIRLA